MGLAVVILILKAILMLFLHAIFVDFRAIHPLIVSVVILPHKIVSV
jgi:hypothetical protein